MKLVNTRCAICDSLEDYKILYEKNFNESDINANIYSARRIPDHIHYQIVKCNKDNLVRSNPILDASSLYNLYKESKLTYEDEIENLAASYHGAIKPILDKLPKGAKILEIGCGNGFILKRLYGAGYENVVGVEPSIDAAGKADALIQKKIIVDILRPDMFAPDAFDFIFFFQVLDHVEDPNAFLKICHNILKPGGFMLAFSHDVESPSAKVLKDKSPIIDIEHVYLYSPVTIAKILKKNGFLPSEIYSPTSSVSFRHLIRLAPMPKPLKNWLLSFKGGLFYAILTKSIRIKLGNLCVSATKI